MFVVVKRVYLSKVEVKEVGVEVVDFFFGNLRKGWGFKKDGIRYIRIYIVFW